MYHYSPFKLVIKTVEVIFLHMIILSECCKLLMAEKVEKFVYRHEICENFLHFTSLLCKIYMYSKYHKSEFLQILETLVSWNFFFLV